MMFRIFVFVVALMALTRSWPRKQRDKTLAASLCSWLEGFFSWLLREQFSRERMLHGGREGLRSPLEVRELK